MTHTIFVSIGPHPICGF